MTKMSQGISSKSDQEREILDAGLFSDTIETILGRIADIEDNSEVKMKC